MVRICLALVELTLFSPSFSLVLQVVLQVVPREMILGGCQEEREETRPGGSAHEM